MNKKAQNPGQIFIYIISIVILGVILLFGYTAIKEFIQKQNQITIVQFSKNLESAINKISSEYGSMENRQFILSNQYKQVCFVRNYWEPAETITYNPSMFSGYPLILDSIDITSKTPLKNVFLIKSNKELGESFDIGKIKMADGNSFKCFDITNARLFIKIEGRGNHALISE